MIETFVINKINQEQKIFEDLWGSLPVDEKLTAEKIGKSSLSEFTKNYVLNVVDESGDRDEILDRIAKANKLRFNYAIRPKWTLITYLFGNYESRPPNDISKKLDLFPFYNFYIDSINEVIRDNFSIFITRNEVSMIIDETNKAIYRRLTTEINNAKIKNFFLQIYSLKYNEQELNLESTIPYSFIKIFLNDKYYFDIEKKFQLVRGISDEYEISLKDVIKVLMNKYDFNDKEPHESLKTEDIDKTVSNVQLTETPEHAITPALPKFPAGVDKTKVHVEEKIDITKTRKEQEPDQMIERKPEHVIEHKPEPVIEHKPEPVIEHKPEPVIENKPEPVIEHKPELVIEHKPEPVIEHKPEPVNEREQEPVIRQKPERVNERKPEQIIELDQPIISEDETKTEHKPKHVIQFRHGPKRIETFDTEPKPVTKLSNPVEKEMNEEKTFEEQNVLTVVESESPEDEPSSAIKKLFSEKQFDKILDRVYKSDFEYTARSFMKLSNYKTWFEASNHLKEVFKINDVDIYNKDVINFVDTLNDYFSERG
jgi:hypothetical protein